MKDIRKTNEPAFVASYRHSVASLVLLSAVCVSIMHCGSTKPDVREARPEAVPTPAVPSELAEMLPKDVHMVVRAHGEKLRGTPFFRAFADGFSQGRGGEPVVRGEFFERLDDMLIGIGAKGDSGESTGDGVLVLLRGNFGRDELRTVVEDIAKRSGGSLREDTRRGLVVYLSGEQVATALNTQTWALGDENVVHALIDALPERAKSGAPKEGKRCGTCALPDKLRPMARRVDFENAHLAVVYDVEQEQTSSKAADPVMELVKSSLLRIGVRADSASGLRVQAYGKARNTVVAAALAFALGSQLKSLDGHPILATMGISDISNRVRSKQNGDEVEVSLPLEAKEENSLAMLLGEGLREKLVAGAAKSSAAANSGSSLDSRGGQPSE